MAVSSETVTFDSSKLAGLRQKGTRVAQATYGGPRKPAALPFAKKKKKPGALAGRITNMRTQGAFGKR